MTQPPTRPPGWPATFPSRTEIGIAKLPARFGAFLIDGFLMVLVSMLGYWIASLFGAWQIDAAWLAQYEQNPNVWPATPPLHVDVNAVFVASVAIAVVLASYAAACWARFEGLPGQRALGLRVVDYETGQRLSWTAAAGRSLTVFGAIGIVMVSYALLLFYRFEHFAIGDTTPGAIGPDSPLYPWADVINAVIFLASAWIVFATVSTTTNRLRRGVQDRIAGSIVVAVRKVPLAWYPGATVFGPSTAWGWPAQGPRAGAPGSRPAPGWTPPGTWTPPGYPAPTNWNGPPGAAQPLGAAAPPGAAPPTQDRPAVSPEPAEPEPTAEPTLEDTPWKRAAELATRSLAGRESAPLGRRVAAYLVDCLLVGLFFWAAFTTLLPAPGADASGPTERISIFAGLAGGLVQIVYFVLGWAYWRATLGQRMLGLAVVEDAGGKALSPMDALVRWAVLQGPFALVTIVPLGAAPFVGLAAGAWAGFLLYSTQADERGQGLHDRFLGSRVVVVQS